MALYYAKTSNDNNENNGRNPRGKKSGEDARRRIMLQYNIFRTALRGRRRRRHLKAIRDIHAYYIYDNPIGHVVVVST